MTRFVGDALCAALVLTLTACGPKPPAEEPEGTGETGKTETTEDTSQLQTFVDRLNAAISEGSESEATVIIESQTAEMIIEFMGLVPEWEPAGNDFSLADYLDWEKENGVSYKLRDETDGKGTLVAIVNGLEEFEGAVTIEGEGDEARLEFFDMASDRRDDILSDGLQREKFIEIVDNINKAISEQDPSLFQVSVTNDTINAHVKLYSYFTAKKSSLTPKGLVKHMKKQGYEYTATKIDVDTGKAVLTVVEEGDKEVLKGDMVFRSEIGKMRLDYAELLEVRLAEEQEKLDAKKGKKGKKKGKKGKKKGK
ncbi:MAG: hypothetical protein JRG91_15095 [Deltaproteobacteria bacterium]|nr:hypothetical protein [Deltaproteobacteria bacterium]